MRRVLLVLMSLLVVASLQAPPAGALPPPERTSHGLTTISPTRVLDTRTGTGAPAGRVRAGSAVEIDLSRLSADRSPVVVINLTVVDPERAGYATAYAGTAPDTSTVNFAARRTVANQAIVRASTDQRISVYTSATAHLVVDVTGYYTRISDSGPYLPVGPARVVDTRKGLGAPKRKLDAGGTLEVFLSDITRTRTSGERAVVLNVTAIGATRSGYVTADPGGAVARPATSTLNFSAGSTVAAMAVVPSDDSVVRLYSSAAVDLVVDVTGYVPVYRSDYQAVPPARLLDTRSGLGAPNGPVAADGTIELTVAGRGGVPRLGVTHPPVAVEVNITAVGPTRGGYLTSYAGGPDRPATSTLNYVAGETRANSATVPLSADGTLTLHVSARTHVVVDVVGYFVAVTPDPVVSPTRLPDATVGQPYQTTLGATGGVPPYIWFFVGDYPDFLDFVDSTTGNLRGTPTTAGTYTFDVMGEDREGETTEVTTVTVEVLPAPE